MDPVFIDTWGWLAYLDRGEAAHGQVLQLMEEWSSSVVPIYTSWSVVSEVCGATASSRVRQAWGENAGQVLVKRFLPLVLNREVVREVLCPSEADWRASIELRARHASIASLSLVDCTIPVLCQQRGIMKVLSGDRRHLPAVFPGVNLVPSPA